MSTAQSFKSAAENVQPHSPIDAVDLRQAQSGLTAPECECLEAFFDSLVKQDVLNARISDGNDAMRCQLQKLNGVQEFRDQDSLLITALTALRNLASERLDSSTNFGGLTVQINTEKYNIDVNCVYVESAHGDQWIIRAREVEAVPTVLDTLGLGVDELRHIRKALNQPRGLISIGTPHRKHLEDWQRAVSRELCAPDRSTLSLAPRVLENMPGVSQTVLPPGERWDQQLWQLAGHTEADVIVLCDDGTHGFAPDQLGVLADSRLVVQILQTPDINSLARRTPAGSSVHRVIMHHAIRGLCKSCSEPHTNPSRLEYGFLDRALPTLSDGVSAWLSASQSTQFRKPNGCDSCSAEGYSGELCVVDSVGEPTTLKNVTELLDESVLVATRSSNLMDMAGRGDVCLDEVKRLISG